MNSRFILLLSAMLWFSCTKKRDASPAPLLQSMVSTVSGETLTTTLQYSGNKVRVMSVSGTSGGNNVNTVTRFTRNALGIIEKIVITNPAYLSTFTSDSIVYRVHYSTSSNRYTDMVNNLFFLNGNTEYDSTYFTYDADARLTKATKLVTDGAGTREGERNEFTYNSDNLIRCTNYISGVLYLEQSNNYDDKINPLGFGKEWILIGSTRNNRRFEQSSLNNTTLVSYNRNGVITSTPMSYTYNANNLPATRTNTVSNGDTQTISYFYQ